jgi:hypothetical protein
MSSITNGMIRKSLASQLDRLDLILDGFPKVITESVIGAVEQAVSSAVIEVLTNPTLRQRLHPDTPRRPSMLKTAAGAIVFGAKKVWGWMKTGWKKVAAWSCNATETVATYTGPVGTHIAGVTRKAKVVLKGAWSRTLKLLALAGRWRKTVLAALAAGITLGVGCYFSGPMLASFVSGVTGFVSTLAASAWRTVVGLLAGDEAQAT